MSIPTSQLKSEIVYPISDGVPLMQSDSARDYLVYSVDPQEC